MSGETRATPEEMKKRVNQVLKWYFDGIDPRDLCHLMSLEWGVSIRQAKRYKKKADDILKKKRDINRNYILNKLEGRLERLFLKARLQGNLNVALGATKELIEFHGLKTLNVNHSGTITLSELFEDEDNER